MSLRLFNTLSMQKEPFEPLQAGKVRMYVCGVTVYDYCHVGHARSAIVFDTIYRYLKHKGYDVTFVRNFTDIDDKIIKRANEEAVSWKDINRKYIAAFHEDMGRLNVTVNPDQHPDTVLEPKATEHISEMIGMIESLEDQGKAYAVDGDVYYSVRTFPEYGGLSGRNIEDLQSGARVDVDERKRDPLDFALWKKSKPGEPSWPTNRWGEGRPGWHIECSAMSRELLGDTFDIHGGGKDLVFPHHENEIAQSSGCTGKPFVKYWLHNGFVNINQEKMSKSLGNFFTIRDILKQYHPEVLRLFLQLSHYRSPIDFADKYLDDARKMLGRFYDFFDFAGSGLGTSTLSDLGEILTANQQLGSPFMSKFEEAMDDDFNTALALGHMNDELKRLNGIRDHSKETAGTEINKTQSDFFDDAARLYYCGREILGLFFSSGGKLLEFDLQNSKTNKIHINNLVEQRTQARREKNWAEADRLRDELDRLGVVIKDHAEGTDWELK